jgi:hypothetical protein
MISRNQIKTVSLLPRKFKNRISTNYTAEELERGKEGSTSFQAWGVINKSARPCQGGLAGIVSDRQAKPSGRGHYHCILCNRLATILFTKTLASLTAVYVIFVPRDI